MYHYDIKLTSGAVILAALLLSITDSKAADFASPAKNNLPEFQQCSGLIDKPA